MSEALITRRGGSGGISTGEDFYQAIDDWILENTKLIEDGQDKSLWDVNVGIMSDELEHYELGDKSIRLTYNGLQNRMDKNNLSLDLTTLQDGGASPDTDLIYVRFWVDNVANISTASGVRVFFSADSTFADANYFLYILVPGVLVDGWNEFGIPKTSFSKTGTVTWGDIQSIRYYWRVTSGAPTEYTSLQMISLIKKQLVDSVPIVKVGTTYTTFDAV